MSIYPRGPYTIEPKRFCHRIRDEDGLPIAEVVVDPYESEQALAQLFAAALELLEVAELFEERAEANNAIQRIPPWEEGSPGWHEAHERIAALEKEIAGKLKPAIAKARGQA